MFEGPSNAYLIDPDNAHPTTLIDTGAAQERSREHLVEELSDHALTVADIDRIFLTHFHYDHAGLAGAIQEESDAIVYAHDQEIPYLSTPQSAGETLLQEERETLQEWGMPNDAIETLTEVFHAAAPLGGSDITATSVGEGETFKYSGGTIEPVHLPGHTAGHLGFILDGRSLVCGDALLPEYTPNVGGADLRTDRPLATFLRSLTRIETGDFETAWPGHGDRMDDPAARVAETKAHHRRRLDAVIDHLTNHDDGTPWTVAKALFGDLAGIHLLNGPGEAFAHLEYLVEVGIAMSLDGSYQLQDQPKSICREELHEFPDLY